MAKRVVHLRPVTVINLGRTKTRCGKAIWALAPGTDLAAAVATVMGSSGHMDVTIHDVLTTCQACLSR